MEDELYDVLIALFKNTGDDIESETYISLNNKITEEALSRLKNMNLISFKNPVIGKTDKTYLLRKKALEYLYSRMYDNDFKEDMNTIIDLVKKETYQADALLSNVGWEIKRFNIILKLIKEDCDLRDRIDHYVTLPKRFVISEFYPSCTVKLRTF